MRARLESRRFGLGPKKLTDATTTLLPCPPLSTHSYGQIFIFCDWFWNTLRVPEPRATNPVFKRVSNAKAAAPAPAPAKAPATERRKTRKVA